MAVTVSVAGDGDVADAQRVMRRVVAEDLGGYRPHWHRDVDDPAAAYLRPERSALFVARRDGRAVGTAAVWPCRLQSPPNPAWLADRYADPSVCELRRVWVVADARRRGAAHALVRAAAAWAVTDGGYRTVYFHTDTGVTGAEPFWRALPAIEVHDARPDPWNCVHFELDVAALLAGQLAGAAR